MIRARGTCLFWRAYGCRAVSQLDPISDLGTRFLLWFWIFLGLVPCLTYPLVVCVGPQSGGRQRSGASRRRTVPRRMERRRDVPSGTSDKREKKRRWIQAGSTPRVRALVVILLFGARGESLIFYWLMLVVGRFCGSNVRLRLVWGSRMQSIGSQNWGWGFVLDAVCLSPCNFMSPARSPCFLSGKRSSVCVCMCGMGISPYKVLWLPSLLC